MNYGESSVCFHCGAPVPDGTSWHAIVLDESRAMCCPGCAAVADSIVASGMEKFYRERTGFSSRLPKAPAGMEALRLFDLGSDTTSESSYAVDGIQCAACIWLIEGSVRALAGVKSADLNIGTGILQVTCDPALCKPSDILAALQSIGYAACPADTTAYADRLEKEKRALSRRLFIAGLSMMQVMMYAVPAYLAGDGTMDADMAGLMRWASLLLTLPAMLYSAQPFFIGAWRNLSNRALGMDVPVALGIVAAFVASVAATFAQHDPVYFDSITMFVFLLLASRYLELQARMRAASALDGLLRSAPSSAQRLPHWPQDRTSEMCSAEALRSGDYVLLRTGDVLAADAVVVEGETSIDLSVITGESRAQLRSCGDALPAGSSNLANSVVVRISREAKASTLALILESAQRARLDKPSLANWADLVAGRFVGALLLFAFATFLYWQHADPAQAWPVLIAVLVVSCPCALSLAAPTVLAAANARLLGNGVLAVRPHVLETLHRSTHIVFDKTGTLTLGAPVLQTVETTTLCNAKEALKIAAGIAGGSNHPMSVALQQAAKGQEVAALDAPAREIAGKGLEAEWHGCKFRLGRADFVGQLTGTHAPFTPAASGSEIYLGNAEAWLARFVLFDALRPDAATVVQHFQTAGKAVLLLSGDRMTFVQQVASKLGIEHAVGECLPEHKVEEVRRLQRAGAIVAMIGDGVNDAAVLAAADVSFAMGGGSGLALASADCVLLNGRLESLCELEHVAAKAARLMKQNLAWAACYNLAAIPAAAFGLINPWVSAVGMSLSSTLVVLNALRVYRRAAPHKQKATPAALPGALLKEA